MNIYSFLKKSCILFLLPLLFASCGGGDIDTYPGDPSPNISVSSSYDFGGIVVDNSSDKTFTITNSGTESLVIGSISLPASSFSIPADADTCSNETLAVNETCSLSIRFSPIEDGEFEATAFIPSNDPGGTVSIGLSGDGYGLDVWIKKIEPQGDCDANVYVNVTSPIVDPLDLTIANFELWENDDEFIDQIFGLVPFYESYPVSVVLAIDWSESVRGEIATINSAANTFISNLDPLTDEAAAFKFNGTIEFAPEGPDPLFYPDPVDDWLPLTDYITENFTGSGGTRLYDAVYESIERARMGNNGKKAVIVLSDGADVDSSDVPPGSAHTLADVIAYANEDEKIPVFTIYYRDTDWGGQQYGKPEVMEQLAEDTGGKYYDGSVVVLEDVYHQISNLLTGEYRITYTSPNCPGDVSLKVVVKWNLGTPGDDLNGQDSGTITFP